jgi:hypothetical protein
MFMLKGTRMRTTCVTGVFAVGFGVAGAIAAGGCFHFEDDCELAHDCPTGATGTSGAATSSSTGSSGTGGTPTSCVPSASADPVADSCGTFVSSSLGVDDTAADRGTKEKPFKSITAALNKANVARVYACAESFSESVTISAAVDLYGGLDCKSWAYVGATTKTKLTAEADKVPLMLTGDATVEDFAITAADAATDGGSSIAVIADQVKATFTRCALVAGAGKAGLAGTTPTDPVGPMTSDDTDIKGNNGKNACLDTSQQFGGSAKENALCPVANGGPLGGQGGVGAALVGGDASGGTPLVAGKGLGGKGENGAGWDCSADGVNGGGQSGTNGAGGTPGNGATGTSALGMLDNSGYTGAPGQPGGVAPPGQGGGGGGGAKGKTLCAGASGGGGGAGGCGGKGGLGGGAGGASIALVSLGATLSFEKVTIKAGVGGDGGNGGDGQVGGTGGNGGNGGAGSGTLDACNGGKGGQGGIGGKGGGGRGGHAIGIAYTGAVMPSTKGATFTKGTPGKGGLGAADMMHDGDSGVQADVQTFQ